MLDDWCVFLSWQTQGPWTCSLANSQNYIFPTDFDWSKSGVGWVKVNTLIRKRICFQMKNEDTYPAAAPTPPTAAPDTADRPAAPGERHTQKGQAQRDRGEIQPRGKSRKATMFDANLANVTCCLFLFWGVDHREHWVNVELLRWPQEKQLQ